MLKIHLKYLLLILFSINSSKAMEIGEEEPNLHVIENRQEPVSTLGFNDLPKRAKFLILDKILRPHLNYPRSHANYFDEHEKAIKRLKRVNKEFYKKVKKLFLISPLAVFTACHNGKIDFVRNWLTQTVNINIRDKNNESLLMPTITQSHLNVVELLLKSGIDIDAQDRHGWTALHFACVCPFDKDIPTAKAIIDLLLANKADIEAKDEDGEPPLFTAVRFNKPDLVKFLLKKGANIHAKNKRKANCLIIANEKHLSIISALLTEEGAVLPPSNDEENSFDITIVSRCSFCPIQ